MSNVTRGGRLSHARGGRLPYMGAVGGRHTTARGGRNSGATQGGVAPPSLGRSGVNGRGRSSGGGRSTINKSSMKKNEASNDNVTVEDDPPIPWQHSEAKKKLTRLFQDESSWVQILSYDMIYDSDPDFQVYKKTNFCTNAKNLFQKIEKEREANEFDRAALTHDRELYPKKNTTSRGYVRYEGSLIEKFLKLDIKEEKNVDKKPDEIWKSRPEYQELPLPIFRPHLYRERQSQKEQVFWQKKRNDKGRKDYDQAMENVQDKLE